MKIIITIEDDRRDSVEIIEEAVEETGRRLLVAVDEAMTDEDATGSCAPTRNS